MKPNVSYFLVSSEFYRQLIIGAILRTSVVVQQVKVPLQRPASHIRVFEFQLLHFQFSFLLLESMSPIWETWVEFLAPGLAQAMSRPGRCRHLVQWMEYPSVSVFLCLSSKQPTQCVLFCFVLFKGHSFTTGLHSFFCRASGDCFWAGLFRALFSTFPCVHKPALDLRSHKQ